MTIQLSKTVTADSREQALEAFSEINANTKLLSMTARPVRHSDLVKLWTCSNCGRQNLYRHTACPRCQTARFEETCERCHESDAPTRAECEACEAS